MQAALSKKYEIEQNYQAGGGGERHILISQN